jgi:hypothetical protein
MIFPVTNTILDIIYRPVLYLKQNVSETEFHLHLQETYSVAPNK